MKRMAISVFAAAALVFSAANLLAPDGDAGEYMLYILTLGALGYAVFFKPVEAFFRRRGGRVTRWLLRVVLLAFAVVIAFLAVMGNTDTATGAEHALIVLGAPLEGGRPGRILLERLYKAADFMRRYPDMPAVLSGGQVGGEAVPEAEAMTRFLTEAGVAPSRLWPESQSQTTYENFQRSLAALEARGLLAGEPIAIVTNSFHCYRARRYAENAGFSDINILPCYTQWNDSPTWYLREAVATVHFWLTGR